MARFVTDGTDETNVTESTTLGAYRLLAELGRGGMADVYLGAAEGPRGSGFSKLAVLKKLRSHLTEDAEFVSMLLDEARLTARLAHKNVVQLFECAHVDGQYFLAMEFLEGQPLHRVIRRIEQKAKAPREMYYGVVADVLAGLHYAHELADYDGTPLGVVHRDVTPHNVLITYDGTVKVVDFGIAKAAGRRTDTQHGTVKGKLRYMSPEQALGQRDLDRRTDIFAAGVILFNAATGRSLWDGCADLDIAVALCEGTYPTSPRERCPEVPEAIDAICRKALSYRREDRYATAHEMQADIEAFLGTAAVELRSQLASTMQQLFSAERAKLRAVLQASALTGSASRETLVASCGTPIVVETTALMSTVAVAAPTSAPMPSAPSVPSAPSASALPVVVGPAIQAVPTKPSFAAGATRKQSRRPRRFASLTMVVAAAACAISGGALFAAPRGGVPARAATPAVVVSDLTTSSTATRSKAEPTPTPAPRASTVLPTTSRQKSKGAVPSRPSRRSGVMESGAPAVINSSAKSPTSEHMQLDKTDPWSGAAP